MQVAYFRITTVGVHAKRLFEFLRSSWLT